MNRRTALKNLTLSLGYAVSVPTLMNILSSCTADVETWTPVFLSKEQKHLVTHLVDIILPSTDIVGGLDVNVPQFIDKMYHDIESASKQLTFQKGADIFSDRFKEMFDKDVLNGSKEQIEELFGSYFNLSEEDGEAVKEEQRQLEDNISADRKSNYFMYKFLFSVRYYTLFGYYTSEKVGEEILNYDPIPGTYQGCVPLEEIGNAWSL